MVKMKRTLVAAVAAFAMASAPAMASEAVQMTDEQLDEVTAAGALNAVFISNPGNASVARNIDFENLGNPESNILCINCELLPANEGSTGGVVGIVNRKHPADANGLPTFFRTVGSGLPGLF
jgi:hypothetical protein